MGMEAGGAKELKADINVVPLVDITLVLLIIFMVMTPMMQRGYDMSIPEKAKTEQLVQTSAVDQMVVEMDEKGTVMLNKKPIDRTALANEITELLVGRSQKIVFFKAHKNLFYQEAIDVMDLIKQGGGIVGLVTTEIQ